MRPYLFHSHSYISFADTGKLFHDELAIALGYAKDAGIMTVKTYKLPEVRHNDFI